jgi:hypothetical protein
VAKTVLNMSNPVFQEATASSKIKTVVKELRKLKVGDLGLAVLLFPPRRLNVIKKQLKDNGFENRMLSHTFYIHLC